MKEYTNVIDVKEFKREYWKKRFAEFRHNVAEKCHDTANFIRENKEILVIAVPAAFGAVKSITKYTTTKSRLRREENLKNLYAYDYSTGHYWHLKRPLTNSEWRSVETMKKSGMSMGDIFASMRVLK